MADSLTQLTGSMHEMSVGSNQIKDFYSDMSSSVASLDDVLNTINSISTENIGKLQRESVELCYVIV